ncbi:MAG: hypothetical protein JJU42_15530 [Rhodobacteraceae bacterium]|nr:hypothetical protein [Paracoccaceae bacterium]
MKPVFPWQTYLLVLAVIAFVALLPVISVLIAGGIATLGGCELNEGFVNPCVFFGVDLGGLLYGMGVMGWFMLLSLPMGALAAAGWVAVWIGHFVWHRVRR